MKITECKIFSKTALKMPKES